MNAKRMKGSSLCAVGTMIMEAPMKMNKNTLKISCARVDCSGGVKGMSVSGKF